MISYHHVIFNIYCINFMVLKKFAMFNRWWSKWLNDSCLVQYVTKAQRKKKKSTQTECEWAVYCKSRKRKNFECNKSWKEKKKKEIGLKKKTSFAMSAWTTTTKDSVLHNPIMLKDNFWPGEKQCKMFWDGSILIDEALVDLHLKK